MHFLLIHMFHFIRWGYVVFTYRYFLYRFPNLCILAVVEDSDEPIGCVVGKMDRENQPRPEEDGEDEDGASNDAEEESAQLEQHLQQKLEQLSHEDTQQTGEDNEAHRDAKSSSGEVDSGIENDREGTDNIEWTGYIGMLAVRKSYRRRGIGKALVRLVLQRMKNLNCTSATLETEVTNTTAQKLYQECFGFIREELLVRYYLNWNDAYRLRLWFDVPDEPSSDATQDAQKTTAVS